MGDMQDMNILGHIGNTPLLKLSRVNESPDVDIFVKCEFMNPGGSIKDRMALSMIEGAERSGRLKPGGTIVDQSTGNTGPALAFVGAGKGYKVQLYLPSQLSSSYNPADRIRIAKLYGCEVTKIDLQDFLDDVESLTPVERAAAFVAIRMAQCFQLQERDPSTWWANQLCNPDNTAAHRNGTGAEILEEMDGDVDAWVASIGTGGTFLGVAETLKDANPEIVVSGVLPSDDPRIEWIQSRTVHAYLEKFGVTEMWFIIENIIDKDILDHEIVVRNEDAKNMADRLCREEGLFSGMSSGANVYAAVQMVKEMKKGSKIVTVLVDRRDRYFTEYPNEHYVE
jgi:cysteine synthase A